MPESSATVLIFAIAAAASAHPFLVLAVSSAGRLEEAALVVAAISLAAVGQHLYRNRRSPSPQSALAPRSADPPTSADFSVFCPKSVLAGSIFEIEVWLYMPADRTRVLERAVTETQRSEVATRAQVPVGLGSRLTIHLALDAFEIEEPFDNVEWEGRPTNASFRVKVPPTVASGDHPATIRVFLDRLPLTKLFFHLSVGTAAPADEVKTTRRDVKRAFASYASADRREVYARVQGISAAGVNVFLDAISLRAGEHWEKRLYQEIDECDELFLFWSEAASRSQWVEKEWRYALERRGSDFISPVPLVDPGKTPPPAELQDRHFKDIFLALLSVP